MGKLTPEIEEALQSYVSGALAENERLPLEEAIRHSTDLQARLREYEVLHHFLVKRGKLEMPSKNFTDKVMSGLDAQTSPSLFSPRNGLLLLLGVIIACGVGLSLLSSGAFDGLHTVVSTNSIPQNDIIHRLPSLSVPLSGKMIINSILFLNLILAFVLIDRTILRPYFQRRSYHGL